MVCIRAGSTVPLAAIVSFVSFNVFKSESSEACIDGPLAFPDVSDSSLSSSFSGACMVVAEKLERLAWAHDRNIDSFRRGAWD